MMCETNDRKKETENKLERKMKNLKLITGKLNRYSQLTKGIANILSSCEQRLASLEETILPIYYQTESLQIQQRNIKHTLKIIDHVSVFYGTSKHVEPIIQAGLILNSNGDSILKPFLEAMEKLQAALDYLETHNSECAEHDKVRKLFSSGGDELNEHFKEVLQHYSNPVPLMNLIDLVRPAEDTQIQSQSNLILLPDYVSTELQCTAKWLRTNYSDEYINVYITLRSNVLHKSIQNLKEHQQALSGESVHSISSAPNSPVLKGKLKHNVCNSKASKLLQHLFEKKANKLRIKESQNSEYSTGLTGVRRSGISLENKDDTVDEQEMVNYLLCIMALLKLMQNEKTLMSGILPFELESKAFEILIQDALDMVVQDGENIATRAKKCVNHHEYSTLLVVLPILKYLQTMRSEYDKIVEDCSETVKSKFSSTHDILHCTAAKALDDFIECIRTDQSTQVPKDGTVHEITSNTLVFLEQLHDFTDIIGRILKQKFAYNSALTFTLIAQLPGQYGRTDDSKIVLGMFIQKVLNELNQTLCHKSKFYSDSCLGDVFQLNNNHQILKALQKSGLINLVHLSKPNFESMYHKMINDNKESYTQSWNKVLNHIWPLEDEHLVNVRNLKLRDKDRKIIKEKFCGFNKEMEEIKKVQHCYFIADDELRRSLKQNNKEFIVPKYKTFYERYTKVSFTKNPRKYIKYSPEQVLTMIDQFFDVSA